MTSGNSGRVEFGPGSKIEQDYLRLCEEPTPQQIAVAIARFAFKDYYERDRPQFTLLANVEAFLSDPANWDPSDPESPAALAREVVRR